MGFPYGFFSRLPIGGCSFALSLGALIAHSVYPATLIKRKSYLLLIVTIGAPLFIMMTFMWMQNASIEGISVWYLSFIDISYALIGGAIIVSILCYKKIASVIDNRVLSYIGKISYGIYVYHLILELFFPILFEFIPTAPRGVEFVVYQFLIKSFTAILVATISWYILERNILELKNNI